MAPSSLRPRTTPQWIATAIALLCSLVAIGAAEKQPINITEQGLSGSTRTGGDSRGNLTESLADQVLKVRGDSAGSSLAPAIPPPMVVLPSKSPSKDENWMLKGMGASEAEKKAQVDAALGVRNYNPDTALANRSGRESSPSADLNSNRGLPSSLATEKNGIQDRSSDPYNRFANGFQFGTATTPSSQSPTRRDDAKQNQTTEPGRAAPADGATSASLRPGFQSQTKESFSQSFANPLFAPASAMKPEGIDPSLNDRSAFNLMPGVTIPGSPGFGTAALLQGDPTRRELNPFTGSIRNELGGISPDAAVSAGWPGAASGVVPQMGTPTLGAALNFFGPPASAAPRNLATPSPLAASTLPPIAPQPAVLPLPQRKW